MRACVCVCVRLTIYWIRRERVPISERHNQSHVSLTPYNGWQTGNKEVILKGIEKSSSKEIVAGERERERERERENVLCSISNQWRRRQG